jgi:hypothetical protein
MTVTSVSKVCAALVKAQAEIGNVPFDSKNPHFNHQFVSLTGALNVIRPIFAKHGLCLLQPASTTGNAVSIETVFLHESGEQIRLPALSMPITERMTAQNIGSCITYMRRYSLTAALGICGTNEDDDGEKDAEIRDPEQYAKQRGLQRQETAREDPKPVRKPEASGSKPEPATGNVFRCSIVYHESKSGTTAKGNPYVKHRIGFKPEGGGDVIYASTFEDDIGAAAEEFNRQPVMFEVSLGKSKYGFDIVTFRNVSETAGAVKEPVDEEDIPF